MNSKDISNIEVRPCSILNNYIKIRNGKAGYTECSFYLNNYTNLTQLQIQSCLSMYFPNGEDLDAVYGDAWIGIL
jgi:hypothetical protein